METLVTRTALALVTGLPCAAQTWTSLAPAMSPSPRAEHALAYDAMRGELVLFGGFAGGPGVLRDTWRFDGVTWTEVTSVSVPSARRGGAMVFDRARSRSLLFGGVADGEWYADTWVCIGTGWVNVTPPRCPHVRIGHAMTYDSARRVVVVFGGERIQRLWRDTWVYDGVGWTDVTPAWPATNPAARTGTAMVFDAGRNVVVLFGGDDGTTRLADTWEYDGVRWTERHPGIVPPARAMHAMVYDAPRGRTLLFGGDGESAELADTWEYDGTDWSPVVCAASPPARARHAMAYDTGRHRALLFGGWDGTTWRADTWEYVPAAAARWSPYGVGCAGASGRTPSLAPAPGSVPALGATFTLVASDLPPYPGSVFFATGLGTERMVGLPLPLDLTVLGFPGCSLWIEFEPFLSTVRTHAGLEVACSMSIPNDPALAGYQLCSQVVCFDSLAPNGVGAASNAGIGTIR